MFARAAVLTALLCIAPALLSRRSIDETPLPPSDRTAMDTLPDRLSFSLRAGEGLQAAVVPYSVFALFVLPGESLPLAVAEGSASDIAPLTWSGDLEPAGVGWRWTAPIDPGLHPLRFVNVVTDEVMTLNAFVLVPYANTERLEGFRVGRYRETPLRNDPSYLVPRGMVKVTEELAGVAVSPNFTLGEFVAKQAGGFPKYLVLREPLLLKLEALITAARTRGIPVSTMRVMSGFRTPYYNRLIGNRTSYSRHVYGDAADVYIDNDGDDVMDDLNGDGRTTLADAVVLMDLAAGLADVPEHRSLVGGLGLYRANSRHGPFVHVDLRGHPARWGP